MRILNLNIARCTVFCEAELRFLLLFLEKENTTRWIVLLGASPQTPVAPLRGGEWVKTIFYKAE
jgi:hypothetical protein